MIKLSNPTTRPSMVMDGLHVDQLLLRIDRNTSIKSINAQGVVYGVDTDGKQVYADTDIKVAEGDFNALVMNWAITNGIATDLTDGLNQLTNAKIQMTLDAPDVFKLMAYFEQATGMIFELSGKADVAGIE